VLNQSELAISLGSEGFEQIYFERLSLREQMRIASEASVLVGGHGSGLAHLLYMPENALVLELFPYKRQQTNDCYEALSTIAPHRYRALESHVMREGDIEIDPEAVRKILREESVI
jgi:capsular polysaccharide biosynthesis protein